MLNYNQFINEALLPSQYREYVKAFNRERYEDLFQKMKEKYDGDKRAYRIYLPLIETEGPVQKEITNFLKANDYEIVDYVDGSCKFKDAKNPSKIGKILTKLEKDGVENASAMMKKFTEDPKRKAGNRLLVCISRHPYDIAGADTDRSWMDCMTLPSTPNSPRLKKHKKELKEFTDEYNILRNKSGRSKEENERLNKLTNEINRLNNDLYSRTQRGSNSKYLICDVKQGSLISYLIKSDDKNITNPIAVLNIKPYINSKDPKDIILVSDNNSYGLNSPEFKKTVNTWLEEVNGKKSGSFNLTPTLYADGKNKVEIYYEEDYKKMFDDIVKHFIGNTNTNNDISKEFNILYTKSSSYIKKIIEEILKNEEKGSEGSIQFIRNLCGGDYIHFVPKNKILEILEKSANQAILDYTLSYYGTLRNKIGITDDELLELLKTNKLLLKPINSLLANGYVSYPKIIAAVDFKDFNADMKYRVITKIIHEFSTYKDYIKLLFDKEYLKFSKCDCGCEKPKISFEGMTNQNCTINSKDIENLKTIGVEMPEPESKNPFYQKLWEMAKKYHYKENILPVLKEILAEKSYDLNIVELINLLKKIRKNQKIALTSYDTIRKISSIVYALRGKNEFSTEQKSDLYNWYQEASNMVVRIGNRSHFH